MANLSHWNLTTPRVLRKPRFRYGSIIVTVICLRSSRKPPENFPNEHSSFGKELYLGNVACRYHLTITAKYLLQVYLILSRITRGAVLSSHPLLGNFFRFEHIEIKKSFSISPKFFFQPSLLLFAEPLIALRNHELLADCLEGTTHKLTHTRLP